VTVASDLLGVIVVGAILVSLALGAIAALAFRELPRRGRRRRRGRGSRETLRLIRERTDAAIKEAERDANVAEELTVHTVAALDDRGATGRSMRHERRIRRHLQLSPNASAQQVREKLRGGQDGGAPVQPAPPVLPPSVAN